MIKDSIIIIPAHNESQGLAQVLKALPKRRIIQIIVVDNASTDNTSLVAKEAGARVIYEGQKGYGQACLAGLSAAFEQPSENIIFIDADFSDHPDELPLLLEQLDNGIDLVIGSRVLGKAEKGALLPQAIFGNWLATFLMHLFFGGFPFTDLGPFRGIKTAALKRLKMEDQDFGWTVEMQGKALLAKLRCAEVPVSYRKRIGQSKITGTIKGTFLAGYKILWTLFLLKFKAILACAKNLKL